MDRVTIVRVSTALGKTDERAGTSKTSSKVNASRISIGSLLSKYHLTISYCMSFEKAKVLFVN